MCTAKMPAAPSAPPQSADTTKAMMNALAYAETEKKIRASSGRKGSFMTTTQPTGAKSTTAPSPEAIAAPSRSNAGRSSWLRGLGA